MATKSAPTERMYNLFVRPLVTEKTSKLGNWLAFVVANDATKPELKTAFERLYGAEVERVNTLIQKGKTKGVRGKRVFRSDIKKAYIKLKDGQTVDLMAGVK
ncbi:MAG TPA: 50S ribosomal protein L23 [Alphaproteobacteria bacterium]|nr:50S ribosomal protein L23 [Alphaproteobacteria bacterium]